MTSNTIKMEKTAIPKLAPFNPVAPWCPRFWHGMNITDWGRLIAERRYRIHRWPMAVTASISSAFVSVVNSIQHQKYYQECQETPFEDDPIFVIGHWRSGTTLIQELMTKDDRFVCPTTYECFLPRAFLVTEKWLKPATSWMLPAQRPMDNMDMGWDVPMEDEFALMTMGMPSTYRRVAFPNETPRHLDYLNMDVVPRIEIERWQAALKEFATYLNFSYRKQLLFKSPPHTGRIKVLLEMFPRARFIHITRNPLKFIPSTIHMWAALDRTNGLQLPHNRGLRPFVFNSFERLYRGYYRDRHLLTPQNSVEIRYEDVVKDLVGSIRTVYSQLRLGGFEQHARSALEIKSEQSRDYKRNQHAVPDELKQEILDRCGGYMSDFGYTQELAAA